jgi:RNA polymerase sigma-70 factor (ECF subfamily)
MNTGTVPLGGFPVARLSATEAAVALTDLDRQLVQRCLAQEPGAWKDFVDRFAGLFVHVVEHSAHSRSVPLSPEDVDDLCSEVLIAILERDLAVLRRFRGHSALATYLVVIARRVAIRELSRRRYAEALGHVQAHQESVDRAGSDNGRIESQELVHAMLQGLPPTEAEIVRLYHLEGKTYHEISTLVGIPENSIGPTLTRAREKLRHSGLAVH